jgi:hypothetical protein
MGSVMTASVLNSVGVDVAAGRVGYRLAKNSTLFNLTSYALPTLSTDCTQGFEATFLYYSPPSRRRPMASPSASATSPRRTAAPAASPMASP